MLENLSKPSDLKQKKIIPLKSSLNKIQTLESTGSRLKKMLIKNKFSEFLKFDTHSEKFKNGYPFLVFNEYLGEQKQIFLEQYNNLKNIYTESKIYLVIDDTYEGLLTYDDINYLENNLKLDGWAVATSNYKIEHPNVFIINYHYHCTYFDNIVISETPFIFNNNLRNKKFLCLNRQERLHRLLTIDYLLEKDLIKHCHVSCQDIETRVVFEARDSIKNFTSDENISIEKFWEKRRYGGIKELSEYHFSEEQKKRLLDNIPLYLENENFGDLDPKNLPNIDSYFRDSYWALVTERDFFRSNLYQGFTEKTVKCLLYGLPFIIIGLPFTLKQLRKDGFLTFSNFIDETYDNIQDDTKRFEAIKEQIDYLSSLNYNELHLLNQKMKPILEHNYMHLQYLHKSIPNIEFLNQVQLWSDTNHLE